MCGEDSAVDDEWVIIAIPERRYAGALCSTDCLIDWTSDVRARELATQREGQ